MGLRKRYSYVDDFKFLIQTKRDFTVKKSRYSDVITMDDMDKKISTTYTDKRIDNRVFNMAKKLKKEVKTHLPYIDECMIGKRYGYNSVSSYHYSFCSDEVHNIDISSAYLTVIHRDGFISDHLFNSINEMDKAERLRIMGLLAYEPECFEFRNGEPSREYSIPNIYKNVFFYAVKEVSEVMMLIRASLGSDFIFFWVDGVYFFDRGDNKKIVSEILEEKGFKYTSEGIKNFLFDDCNEKNVILNFYDEKGKYKNIVARKDSYKQKLEYGIAIKKYLRDRTEENFLNLLNYQK